MCIYYTYIDNRAVTASMCVYIILNADAACGWSTVNIDTYIDNRAVTASMCVYIILT